MSNDLATTSNKLAIKNGYEFATGMNLEQMVFVAQQIIDSGLCPNNITEPQQVITIAQMGKELGFSLLTSLNNIDNIQGKPTLSYRAVGALLQQSGYGVNWVKDFEAVQYPDGGVDYVTEVEIVDFTVLEKYKREAAALAGYPQDVRALLIETLLELKTQIKRRMNYKWSDANNAGYLTKHQWTKLPREMMRARCLVSAVRAFCPQVMMGLYEQTEIDNNTPLQDQPQTPVDTITFVDKPVINVTNYEEAVVVEKQVETEVVKQTRTRKPKPPVVAIQVQEEVAEQTTENVLPVEAGLEILAGVEQVNVQEEENAPEIKDDVAFEIPEDVYVESEGTNEIAETLQEAEEENSEASATEVLEETPVVVARSVIAPPPPFLKSKTIEDQF